MQTRRQGERENKADSSLSIEEALRVTRAQLWRLSAQHLSIQEDERRRISAELHDGLGQTLSLVKLSIEAAAVDAEASSKIRETMERLSSQVKSALVELRRMAMNLRPSTLDDLGLVATLSWYLREFEATCPQMKLERDISVGEAEVPDALKISIFRIVQEATNNARKHAKAGRIKIGLTSVKGLLKLLIEDDGQGLDLASVARQRDFKHGLGLQSMKERAELSGGTYDFQSAPGRGTRISVTWKQEKESAAQCPVIPLTRTSAQAMCKLAPAESSLHEDFSACLTCVRSLALNDEPQKHSRRSSGDDPSVVVDS